MNRKALAEFWNFFMKKYAELDADALEKGL